MHKKHPDKSAKSERDELNTRFEVSLNTLFSIFIIPATTHSLVSLALLYTGRPHKHSPEL